MMSKSDSDFKRSGLIKISKYSSCCSTIFVLMLAYSTQLSAVEKQLKDPTRPPISSRIHQRKKITHFNLSEIKISKKNKQAVINGQRLKQGETIGNYHLKKIKVGYVILENAQNSIRVDLIKNPIIRKKL